MLGGFTPVGGAENDERVQKAAEFAVNELSSKTGASLKLSKVVSASTQVVAGTNYRMKLQASAGASTKTYDVTVYEMLPHMGSKMELSKYEEVAGETCGAEAGSGGAEQAAEFAAKHVSSMSNSLIPLQLKQVISAKTEGNTHDLKISVGREGLADSVWRVVVEQGAENQYRVKSVAAE